MEEVFNIIKNYLINQFPDYLEEFAEEGLTLPDFTENNIIFGAVDLSRYEMPVLCAILPENQTIEENTISEWQENTKVTIAFLFQKDKYETLVKRMCKYSAAFKKALMQDYTLNSTCENNNISDIKYYYDAGSIKDQLVAVEFELTIFINNSY